MPSFAARIQLTLPPWWGTAHPNLDTLVAAYAAGSETIDLQTQQLVPFLRIGTTTGNMLDIAAYDFYGDDLSRQFGESDESLRQRIKTELFVPRGVRPIFEQRLNDASGTVPTVIDPRRTADTGYCGHEGFPPTLFYNSRGHDCYTNIRMPYQWFVLLSNRSPIFFDNELLAYTASLMPAGTVSWVRIL